MVSWSVWLQSDWLCTVSRQLMRFQATAMATRLVPTPKVVVDIYGLVNLFDPKHPIVDKIEEDRPE